MKNILLADDHTILREGLKRIINDTHDLRVAGEAANGFEVLQKIRKDAYAIVILDISMPGMNGLDTLKQIRLEQPRLPVLMLSVHPEDQYAVRVLKAGAGGYLTKESAPDELIGAIQKVLAGGTYVSSALAERLARTIGEKTADMPHELLSDREYQVLCHIGGGKTITQISEELKISVKTVSTYRTRILEKMQMQTNADLTRYAIENNLV